MNNPIHPAATVGILIALASCGMEDPGSLSEPPPPIIEVGFGLTTFTEEENATTTQVEVLLSQASGGTVSVEFYAGGNAAPTEDYVILTPSPLVFPPGVVEMNVLVQLFEDTLGEQDEVVDLALMLPTGAILGSTDSHQLIIADEDAQLILDDEPNNKVSTANTAGPVRAEEAYQVQGNLSASAQEFDIFQINTPTDTDVFIELRGVIQVSEMGFYILDSTGQIMFTHSGPANAWVSTTYESQAGEILYVAAWVKAADTDYELNIVGLPSTLTSNGGPGTGADPGSITTRKYGRNLVEAKLGS